MGKAPVQPLCDRSVGRVCDLPEGVRKGLDAGQVLAGQALQSRAAIVGERQVQPTVVDSVADAREQPGVLCSQAQLDGAVMTYVQLLGRVADGRSALAGVSSDHEQQLVKGRCETSVVGCLFAPAQEVTQL
jgi:hypothetical protein